MICYIAANGLSYRNQWYIPWIWSQRLRYWVDMIIVKTSFQKTVQYQQISLVMAIMLWIADIWYHMPCKYTQRIKQTFIQNQPPFLITNFNGQIRPVNSNGNSFISWRKFRFLFSFKTLLVINNFWINFTQNIANHSIVYTCLIF